MGLSQPEPDGCMLETALLPPVIAFDKDKGWAASILVQPGRYDDYAPFGESVATVFLTSTQWANEQDSDFDYGLIRLNEPLGDVCGFFGYGSNMGSIGTYVTISGYPEDKNPSLSEQWQWQMSGLLALTSAHKLYYFIDTAPGQSGAPIFKLDNTVIGIHTGGNAIRNRGTRITTELFQQMQTW